MPLVELKDKASQHLELVENGSDATADITSSEEVAGPGQDNTKSGITRHTILAFIVSMANLS